MDWESKNSLEIDKGLSKECCSAFYCLNPSDSRSFDIIVYYYPKYPDYPDYPELLLVA